MSKYPRALERCRCAFRSDLAPQPAEMATQSGISASSLSYSFFWLVDSCFWNFRRECFCSSMAMTNSAMPSPLYQ